jgi:galactonate dehydratase
MNTPLSSAVVLTVDVTPRTRWIFVEIADADGVKGFGEATLAENSSGVADAARSISKVLVERRLPPAEALALLGKPGSLVEAAAVSAVDQALHDILARRRGVSLAALLGGERREQIGLYANINRRTTDRTPEGFAESARVALNAGHNAIKIAPFDEITPAVCVDAGFTVALESGLRRIAAVRETIGPERRLMVDCHWRFTEAKAAEAIDACAEFSLHWFECPISEAPEFIPAIVRLRDRAHERHMLLAGGEKIFTMGGLTPFVDVRAYDVIMPDVKYVGGLGEMLRMAGVLKAAGIAFSPHNPTGPISHAASLEVCAAVAESDLLEHQFDETPLFDSLVSDGLPKADGGFVELAAGRLGIGVVLDPDVYRLAAE